jgi:hypothetical protein
MDDTTPPRVFNVVTSANVNYNMDFVEYLIKQETERRIVAREPALSKWELGEYRRKIIGKLIVQGDTAGALKLRPQSTRKQLNEHDQRT